MILSIVIPCYNHGQYIQDAIDSILTYHDQPIEIIIVDDGSTDLLTINKMEELKTSGYHVIQQQNSGLAKTRNNGIEVAKGKYILPLDADNKIKPDYIRKAIDLLNTNEYDIVYAKPLFFGDVTEERKFTPRPFNGIDLISANYIDACAIYRKEVWLKNNGYDSKMPHQGYEDWDFWLNSYFTNFKFKFIDEELYEYRILLNSMIVNTLKSNGYEETKQYLIKKYSYFIYQAFIEVIGIKQIYHNERNRPLRTSIKYLFIALKKILNNN